MSSMPKWWKMLQGSQNASTAGGWLTSSDQAIQARPGFQSAASTTVTRNSDGTVDMKVSKLPQEAAAGMIGQGGRSFAQMAAGNDPTTMDFGADRRAQEALQSQYPAPTAPTAAGEGGGFLGAIKAMGKAINAGGGPFAHGFDRRRGLGNLMQTINAYGRGQAIREQEYAQSMDNYRREMANIQEQIRRNEINMPMAKAKLQEAQADAKMAENKLNEYNKPMYWDSVKLGTAEKGMIERYLSPYMENGAIKQGLYSDFMNHLMTPGSPLRTEWYNAKIDDYQEGIDALKMKMNQGPNKNPEQMQQQITQLEQARDLLRTANGWKPEKGVEDETQKAAAEWTLKNKQADYQKKMMEISGLADKQGRPDDYISPDKAKKEYFASMRTLTSAKDSLNPEQKSGLVNQIDANLPFLPKEIRQQAYTQRDKYAYGDAIQEYEKTKKAQAMYLDLINAGIDENEIAWRMKWQKIPENTILETIRKMRQQGNE